MAKPINDRMYFEEEDFDFNARAYLHQIEMERPVSVIKNSNQRTFIVADEQLHFFRSRCRLVNKDEGSLELGEMIMRVYDENDVEYNVFKLYHQLVWYWDADGNIKRAKWQPGTPAGDGYVTFTAP